MKIVVVIGCSDTATGKPITYEPTNYAWHSSSWELQQMLGSNYIVRQCGEGGRSLAQGVDFSIFDENWQPNQKVFQDIMKFTHNKADFDIVFEHQVEFEDAEWIFVHAWGVNDSDHRNWDIAKETFVESYHRYLAMFPQGRHIVSNNPPVFGNGHYANEDYPDGNPNDGKVQPELINPLIKIVQETEDVESVDVSSVDKREWTNDNIHHNTLGNIELAKCYYKSITGEDMTYKDSCKYHPYFADRENLINFDTLTAFWTALEAEIPLSTWVNLTAEAQFNMYLDFADGGFSGTVPPIVEPPVTPPVITGGLNAILIEMRSHMATMKNAMEAIEDLM